MIQIDLDLDQGGIKGPVLPQREDSYPPIVPKTSKGAIPDMNLDPIGDNVLRLTNRFP